MTTPVQTVALAPASGQPSYQVTINNVQPNNDIVVVLANGDNSGSGVPASVNDGAAYNQEFAAGARSQSVSVWRLRQSAGGTHVITITPNAGASPSSTFISGVVYEVPPLGAFDASSIGANGASTGPVEAVTGTLSGSGGIAFGAAFVNAAITGLANPGAPWVNQQTYNSNFPSAIFSYQVPGSTSPLTFNAGNISIANNWTAAVIVYQLGSTPPPAPSTPSFVTTSLPNATAGGSYAQQVIVQGGVPPYTHASPDAKQPFYIDWDGWVLGAPTSTGSITIHDIVTDSFGSQVEASFTITVDSTLRLEGIDPTLGNLYIPRGIVGNPYSHNLVMYGGSGTGYTFAITSGSLAPGLSLAANGSISGTPTRPGSYFCSIQGSDSSGNKTSVTILAQSVEISTTVSRPNYNSAVSNGLFVLNGTLYQANGNELRIRGVNRNHYDSSSWQNGGNGALTGCNAARVFMFSGQTASYAVTQCEQQYFPNGILPILCMNTFPDSTGTSGNSSNAEMAAGLASWVSMQSTLASIQGQIVLNIANEWNGGGGAAWAAAYQCVKGSISGISGTTITINSGSSTNPFANCPFAYIAGAGGITPQVVSLSNPGGSVGAWTVQSSVSLTGYSGGGTLWGGAIGVMRGAGYTSPLLIDADGDGQAYWDLITYGATLQQSDPLQNCLFAYHAYGSCTNFQCGIYNIATVSGQTAITLEADTPYHPFAPGYPGTTSNTYSGINSYSISGVQGLSGINGIQPSTTNIGGSQSSGWTVTLTGTFGGTYTGGGVITAASHYNVILSQLSALQASNVCVGVFEFGPGNQMGAPITLFTGSISGATMNVSAVQSGVIIPNSVGTYGNGTAGLGGNGVVANTTVNSQTSGTTGLTGAYPVSHSQTVGSEQLYMNGQVGPSPTNLSIGELITACEAYDLPWCYWATDDHNIGTNQECSWIGWFGMFSLSTNFAVPSDLTAAGMDVVFNPRFGLRSLANPLPIVVAATFDYYIGPNGSDSNPGTLASPWAVTSINSKQATYTGKRVGFLPGTYDVSSLMTTDAQNPNRNPVMNINGGVSNNARTYLGSSDATGLYSPRTAIFDAKGASGLYGGGNSTSNAIMGINSQVPNSSYWTVDGLVFKNFSVWAFHIGTSPDGSGPTIHDFTLQNCEFTGGNASSTGASGANLAPIIVYQGQNGLITNNYIHDNSGYYGSDAQHFSAVYQWGIGASPTTGITYSFNTIIRSGNLHSKEPVQYNCTINNNYIDMSGMATPGAGQCASCIAGFGADGGAGTLTVIKNNILISDQMAYIGLANDTEQNGWYTACQVYNNTCVATANQNSSGAAGVNIYEMTAGIKIFTYYNNLFYDAGFTTALNYGYILTNIDVFNIGDYNIYGGHDHYTTVAPGVQNDASITQYSSLAAYQAAVSAETHSSSTTTNPFTNNGALALQYQVQAGSVAYQTGRVGGTSAGAICNVGAWDGTVTQIGCNFAQQFDYYISTTGSDSNPGTLASPWSITALNSKQSTYAGKRVGLIAGTYDVSGLMGTFHSPALTINGGTSAASPTYIGSCNAAGVYTPRVVTLDAKGATGFYGGSNSNISTIMGIAQQDAAPGGPTPANWGNVTVDGLVFINWSLWAFQVGSFDGVGGNVPNVQILNCQFSGGNANNSTGISGVHAGALELYSFSGSSAARNGCVVSNCFFTNNIASSSNDTHYAAITAWGGISVNNSTSSTGLIIEKCTFVNTGPVYGVYDTGILDDAIIQQNYFDATSSTPAMGTSPLRCFANPSATIGTVIRNNIAKGGLGFYDTGSPGAEGTWGAPLSLYNNTTDLDGGIGGNGPGSRMVEAPGFSGRFKNYNNLLWDNGDTGIGGAGCYGYASGSLDGFLVCDYNIYGTQTGSNIFTGFSASGGSTETSYSTLSSWKTAIGGLEVHSSQSSSNPFTSNGSRSLAYQVQSGSPAYQTGKTGGTSGGATVNVGAWDGIVTQIGSQINGAYD